MNQALPRTPAPSRLPLARTAMILPGLLLILGALVMILDFHQESRLVRTFTARAAALREAVYESFLALRSLDATMAEGPGSLKEPSAQAFGANPDRNFSEHVREAIRRVQGLATALPPNEDPAVSPDAGALASKIGALRSLSGEMSPLIQDRFPFGATVVGREQALALERLLKTFINLAADAEAELRAGLERDLAGPSPIRMRNLGIFLALGAAFWLVLIFSWRSGGLVLNRLGARIVALTRDEERFHQAEILGRSGSFDQDLADRSMRWSQELFRLLGFTPDEITPSLERLTESLPPALRQTAAKALEQARQQTEPVSVQGRVCLDEGRERVLILKAALRGGRLVGLLRDASEEAGLGRAAQLVQALEQAQDTVLLLDEQGLVRYVSPAWSLVSGRDPKHLLGRDLRALAVERFGEAYARQVTSALTRGEPWTGRLGGRREDGGPYTVEASVAPYRAEEASGFVAVLRDVTHEEGAEKRQRQAQKMEALGTLAGGIAHDFNNILGAIIGYTELSLDDLPEASPTRRNLQRVLDASKRADELVKQILAFSRQSELELRPVRVDLIVKEALKLLNASLPKTIEIHTDIEKRPLKVFADPTQIHQVVMNLCANSSYAMRETVGSLEVRLIAQDLDGEAASMFKDVEPGPYVLLQVRDSGHGIDPGIMDRIFDPFFTTKKRDEGTGMGLAVVHGIVKHLGGDVQVESELGRGTVVSVYLPRIDSPEESPVLPEPDPAPGQGRILFVDDEEPLVDAARQMLERLGYHVVVASDGFEALSLFEPNPEAYDLAITDQTMPRMTGVELASRLRAINPDLPVILCTGFSQTLTPERAAEMDLGFLMKPVNKTVLAAVVKKALALRRKGEDGA